MENGSIKKRSKFIRYLPLTILALPGLIYLFINNYIPMAGMFIAFKNVNFQDGIFNSPWVGFENFEYLFKTPDAFIITRNTILYNLGFIVINTVMPVLVAILLNEVRNKYFERSYQSFFILPNFISIVVIAYIVYAFLSVDTGFMNKAVLPLFGMEAKEWYTEPQYWPYILNIVNVWKSTGFFSVIFFASIIGIDQQLYEAATLDGASKWKQITNITLPLIKPTIIMMVLMNIGRIFYSDFGMFFQVPMNNGALFETTNVIDTYVYRALMQLGDMGMSSAAGVYQSLVGFILVLLSNYTVRKLDKSSALF